MLGRRYLGGYGRGYACGLAWLEQRSGPFRETTCFRQFAHSLFCLFIRIFCDETQLCMPENFLFFYILVGDYVYFLGVLFLGIF